MNVSSQIVLWEGSPSDLTSIASGGRLTTSGYRVTEDAVHFASGVLSSREEVVPLWAVRDIDFAQSMAQRARGIGDLTLKIDGQAAQDYGQRVLVLKAIKEPKQVRTLILGQANKVRAEWNQRTHERALEQQRAGAMHYAAPTAPPVTPTGSGSDDLMTKLVKLGEMKQAGLLTDDEFSAAKAKLLT
jgi:hypothetical protein